MPSVRDPTYLLAPNWTYRPNGPIALGNIIVDPFRPQYAVSRPTKPLPKTETATENNWVFETEKIRSVNVSIWTRLFNQLSIKLGPNRQKTDTIKIVMESLETTYFRDEPSMQDIHEIAKEPIVQSVLKADSLFRSPVYMVTGLKIAKGFQLVHHGSSGRGLSAEILESVAPDMSVGGNANIEITTATSKAFEAADDVVFAYQLLIIKPKGWGSNTTFKLDDYRHKAAMLVDSNNDEEGEEEIEIEYGGATVDDVVIIQEGITEVNPDQTQQVWLFQDE
ncbi:uncharacterized protein Triagg1_1398 [Trichoderma aggressivum f. europaeum]|uniref:Uncharacterized protein n=1 Tax=Trichoderma aggressivum f. europaeum TaxID=173218 RepID=A0AAE1M314_9HYPO|nr:hypothetical protein Triagg1_1398 [Trichoderma aggressivum f. europaeum]